MDDARTLRALAVVLGVMQEKTNQKLTEQGRKTKRKLASWRQLACKLVVGESYRVEDHALEMNGYEVFNGERLIYVGKKPGHLFAWRSHLPNGAHQIRHSRVGSWSYVFRMVDYREYPIILAAADLHHVYEVGATRKSYHFMNDLEPLDPEEQHTSVEILLHTGEIMKLQVNVTANTDQIWNAVERQTPGELFHLFCNDKRVRHGCLFELNLLNCQLRQELVTDPDEIKDMLDDHPEDLV